MIHNTSRIPRFSSPHIPAACRPCRAAYCLIRILLPTSLPSPIKSHPAVLTFVKLADRLVKIPTSYSLPLLFVLARHPNGADKKAAMTQQRDKYFKNERAPNPDQYLRVRRLCMHSLVWLLNISHFPAPEFSYGAGISAGSFSPFGKMRGFHTGLDSFELDSYSNNLLTGNNSKPGSPRALIRA